MITPYRDRCYHRYVQEDRGRTVRLSSSPLVCRLTYVRLSYGSRSRPRRYRCGSSTSKPLCEEFQFSKFVGEAGDGGAVPPYLTPSSHTPGAPKKSHSKTASRVTAGPSRDGIREDRAQPRLLQVGCVRGPRGLTMSGFDTCCIFKVYLTCCIDKSSSAELWRLSTPCLRGIEM